jgi:site-specific DNA recombinase
MIETSNSERQTLKDIAAGKYSDNYLVYNRKSTDDTENQKNSIKYQKSENVRFAFREHLLIAPLTLDGFATDGIVSERHSGFKESLGLTFGNGNTVQYKVDRPKFHRLVHWLSDGYFKGVIFL